MKPYLSPREKEYLLKLIIQAGLNEDFTKWLEDQGYKFIFGKLDNIPDELIEAYVKEKKLLDLGEEEYKMYYEIGEVEPESKRNYIPAKKTKSRNTYTI